MVHTAMTVTTLTTRQILPCSLNAEDFEDPVLLLHDDFFLKVISMIFLVILVPGVRTYRFT